jgi:hypothetical protein
MELSFVCLVDVDAEEDIILADELELRRPVPEGVYVEHVA